MCCVCNDIVTDDLYINTGRLSYNLSSSIALVVLLTRCRVLLYQMNSTTRATVPISELLYLVWLLIMENRMPMMVVGLQCQPNIHRKIHPAIKRKTWQSPSLQRMVMYNATRGSCSTPTCLKSCFVNCTLLFVQTLTSFSTISCPEAVL